MSHLYGIEAADAHAARQMSAGISPNVVATHVLLRSVEFRGA